VKKIKTVAISACSLMLGIAIGALFVWRSYYHSMSSRCFVGAADSLMQLQQLRSGKIDSAIQHVEVNLDGDLIGLWGFYKDTSPEKRDPHVLKLLDKIRDYRSQYPRTTNNADFDKSVSEVLHWDDNHNK
jgi:hypothetical protein